MASNRRPSRVLWRHLCQLGQCQLFRELVELGYTDIGQLIAGAIGWSWTEGRKILVFRKPGSALMIVGPGEPKTVHDPNLLFRKERFIDPGAAQALEYHPDDSSPAGSPFAHAVG